MASAQSIFAVRPPQLLTVADLAWAAGLIDGEGCIRVVRSVWGNNRFRCTLALSVKMVHKETIRRLWDLFPGGCPRIEKRIAPERHVYLIAWHGAIASDIILRLRPHLFTKAAEADIALEYAATLRFAATREETCGVHELFYQRLRAAKGRLPKGTA